MTNALALILWFTTNYIDSPVDARGGAKFRTNIVTQFKAAEVPGLGWATNAATVTNISLLQLRWMLVSTWAEPTNMLPPLPK